ncbi:ATP-dependent RNA helicase HrpA [Planctomycetales bacterium 10988]|nr:ATP-dependent RNA helicase HrpA [Planctomycetales bacterium 10988]
MTDTPSQEMDLPRLRRAIDGVMLRDRFRFRRKWQRIEQAQQQGKPFDRSYNRLLEEIEASKKTLESRRENLPKISYDEELPIAQRKAEILETIEKNQVIIICGETGSGKSTQLPKMCLELGRGVAGMIGHTQPRRIAARSVASRVAEELGCSTGKEVGYKIRFTDHTDQRTYIKLMTDGILLAETQGDRYLDAYDTIIIDEAHERSLNIDFLLGYLKRLLPKRPNLKVIVTSATLDAQRFSEHFQLGGEPAPILEVSGRTYPVDVYYRPAVTDDSSDADQTQQVRDAVLEAARIDNGDILIFMATEHEIRETAKVLRGTSIPGDYPQRKTEILPLYGRLSTAEQNKVFQPHSHRRIVIATNVAESSLTVPGIRYVIDPGTARISRYSARSKVQRLPIEPISQASADQRKGRCGRVGPGICFRLYSEEDYESRERYTMPELQRTNLAAVILQTKHLQLGEIETFPFIDPPKPTTVQDGYRTLFELGAIDEKQKITPLGNQLSRLPVDPRIARIILAAQEEHCLAELLIIASAIELQDPRERPVDKQQAADQAHQPFQDEQSDFISYLKLWDFYHDLREKLSRNQLKKACHQNFLNYNRMREWSDIHRQLKQLVIESGTKIQHRKDDYQSIHRALLTGLLSNIAYKPEKVEYIGSGGKTLNLWPGSGCFEKKPKWIVAAELVETTRRYARTVAQIQPEWIEPLADHLLKRTYQDPHWSQKMAAVMGYEKVSLFGLTIVPRRRIHYSKIDPKVSRELFIQHGFVEEDFQPQSGQFFKYNQEVLEKVKTEQAKTRKHQYLLGDEARFEFYDARLPQEVTDGISFNRWWKKKRQTDPDFLNMSPEDLVTEVNLNYNEELYPETLQFRGMKLPIEYHFAPGTERDGILLKVPQEGVHQLDQQRLGWLVPGLLEEKVLAMIKSLPKSLRRQFVPAPDRAKQVVNTLTFGQGDFRVAVADALSRIVGESIPVDAFQDEKIPPHLQMTVAVIDEQGEELAASQDVATLHQKLGPAKQTANGKDAAIGDAFVPGQSTIEEQGWHQDGLTDWDFEALPELIQVERAGMTLAAYPAIVDQGEAVGLRLLDSPERAFEATHAGVRRLFYLKHRKDIRSQVSWLPKLDELLLFAASLGSAKELREQLGLLLTERAFLQPESPQKPPPIPRSADTFEIQRKGGYQNLGLATQEILKLVRPLFTEYHQARLAFEEAQSVDRFKEVTADIQEQLQALTAGNFLLETPWRWLQQYSRYFEAIAKRVEKLKHGGLARDQKQLAMWKKEAKRYRERAERHAERQIFDPELVQFRWMLEEYRVSLFAQELGTFITVSEPRLEKQFRKIRP